MNWSLYTAYGEIPWPEDYLDVHLFDGITYSSFVGFLCLHLHSVLVVLIHMAYYCCVILGDWLPSSIAIQIVSSKH